MVEIFKAHAHGNDFLVAPAAQVGLAEAPRLAKAMCDRHRGVGADGLILFEPTRGGAAMRLFNADGSHAEVSGNGVRCLAAILLRHGTEGAGVAIDTEAGRKSLTLLELDGPRFCFRASMGAPEDLTERTIALATGEVRAITLSMGNPQCVVIEPRLDEARLQSLGPALSRHAAFPAGTNVELVVVERPDFLRILIWERGVGPTESSGTGTCAAAVAAGRYGGAARDVVVEAPGGSQRVEWVESGEVFLTGWAELTLEGRWIR
jgi:diaminopimelate epimerase